MKNIVAFFILVGIFSGAEAGKKKAQQEEKTEQFNSNGNSDFKKRFTSLAFGTGNVTKKSNGIEWSIPSSGRLSPGERRRIKRARSNTFG